MTEIDYYSLSRAVQDSLRDSLSGLFAPMPLLVRRGARRLVLAWLATSAVAAFLLTGVWGAGFGSIDLALSIQPLGFVPAYVVLIVIFAMGVLNALAYLARANALPFSPGIYVFPANLIDARQPKLRVYSL